MYDTHFEKLITTIVILALLLVNLYKEKLEMDKHTNNLNNENYIYGSSPANTRRSINYKIKEKEVKINGNSSQSKKNLISWNDFFNNIKQSHISLKIDKHYGTGFFVEIPIPSKESPLRGIMTNNHVINEKSISNNSFNIYMANNFEDIIEIEKDDCDFMFTSELIDITFIALKQEKIDDINPYFLCSSENDANINDSILIFQIFYKKDNKNNKSNTKKIYFANGTIRELHGFDYYHGISTKFGSSGSPLLNKNFEVVGVHKSGKGNPNDKKKNNKYNINIATKYSEIEFAIRMFYEMPKRIECAKLSARSLEDNEIEELQKKGLHSKFSVKDIKDVESEIERIVEKQNEEKEEKKEEEKKEKKREFRLILKSLFYCDCSKELLFYKTNYAWYFAKSTNDIDYFLLNCLKSLEWFPIIPNDDEEMNINIPLVLNDKELNLIYWLKSTNFKYL